MKALLSILSLLFLTGCVEVVLDPDDPFENPGPYSYSFSNLRLDTVTSTNNSFGRIYYPNGNFADNSLPLVVFAPGFNAYALDYAGYFTHLASHGYIVFAFEFVNTSSDSADGKHDDKAIQFTEAVSYMLNTSSIANLIDTNKVAAMGHSLGGKIAFMAAAQDDRIKSIIGLDPSNAGGPPCAIAPEKCDNYPAAPNPGRGHIGVLKDITSASSLIFRAAPDITNPAEEFNAFYFFYGDDNNGNNAAPAPSYYVNFAGLVSHASFLTKINTKTTPIVQRTTVAWLKYQFEGIDTSDYLTGSIIQKDINQNRIRSVETRL